MRASLRRSQRLRGLVDYVGKGKAFGDVSRSGKDDDREPINWAVRAARTDLFGKLERDSRFGTFVNVFYQIQTR